MLQRGSGSDDDLLKGQFGKARALASQAFSPEMCFELFHVTFQPIMSTVISKPEDQELFVACARADGLALRRTNKMCGIGIDFDF